MKQIFVLVALASVVVADITFNVIGFPSADDGAFGVSIGGQVTKLTSNENNFPVWTGTVPGSTSAVEYSYVELSGTGSAVKTEAIKRKFADPLATSTPYEFFERPITHWEFPKIPYTYLATYPSKTKAFKPEQIATIHVIAPPEIIAEMNANPMNDKKYKVDFRFINNNTIHSVRNVTFKTGGKSSKEHSKQAFKFKFDTKVNQTFFHRPNIKLRSMVMDPTMMREKLYIDLLNSAGIPTQQGAWVRLFINKEAYGLYFMVDDIGKSFLKQTVHGGDSKIKRGSLVQMNAFEENGQTFNADLAFKGPAATNYNKDNYKSVNLGQGDTAVEPLKEIIDFMKDLQDFNPASTPDPVAYWESRSDLQGILRNMALEYLGGAFDNYWLSASNYFMYKNPAMAATGKWQWIPTDFDGTFGNGNPYPNIVSYKSWYDNKNGERPLVAKLILNNAVINPMFEQVLKELVSTAFKPEALIPRINAYHDMLRLDAQWDYSLKRHSPGIDQNFTINDFDKNLDEITPHMSYSLRGWVRDMANFVANELKFTISAGLDDRVVPPPREDDKKSKKPQDDPQDDDNQRDKNAGSRFSPKNMMMTTALPALLLFAALMS
ncbi:hypothetical protein BGX28_007134 [Mortierella sp. GBA30]|nr:hypothetical protein BGX28_007134 [Mortierella sp. GBA30]